MKYRESKPSFQFSSIVERYWSIEHCGSVDAPVEPVLPDGCPEIVFNLADRFQRISDHGEFETQATAIVSGQIRSRLLIKPTGRVSLFGVRFLPHAAAGFLRTSMSSLTDQVVPLKSVIGALSDELESTIEGAGTFEQRVAVVEAVLERRRSSSCNELAAERLASVIVNSGGRISVRVLADDTGIGERRIGRMFDKYVGVSPKLFSRIVRFRGVVRSIEAADSFGMLDTALSFGYFRPVAYDP